jgi:phage terminase large subunit
MRTLSIQTAKIFEPLLAPARYKGAWGGRGAAKSHFFSEKLIEDSLAEPGDCGEGLRSVCIREVQKDLAQSSKLLIEAKLIANRLGEADGFKVYRDQIQTPGDGLMIFKGMNDYTADSIKSLEGFKRGWWEEAQSATAHSLNLYRPTLRANGAERWFSWNPRRKTDPTDVLLRGPSPPTGSVVINANWRDNPWFTDELEQERLDCLKSQPEMYNHIWEGGYVTVLDGAYYAKDIAQSRLANRIGRVSADPLLTHQLFFDIGGTGRLADAVSIWVAQFVGREIRALDYYEAVGQPLSTHLAWMRERGYTPGRAQVVLPHDGAQSDKVHDVSYESSIKAAGYHVEVIKNQGRGAAKARIEAGRRYFPSIWFNKDTTEAGLDALGWYHEKKDDVRGIGLGPEHDWASHAADSFGLMCIAADKFRKRDTRERPEFKYEKAYA